MYVRTLLFLFLFLKVTSAFAQQIDDKDTIGVGLVAYRFNYGTGFDGGSLAIGPSFVMHGDKWSVELSIPIDLTEYYSTEGLHFNSAPLKHLSGFMAFLFHYTYLHPSPKVQLFATGGALFGGSFSGNGGGLGLLAGTGASFFPGKLMEVRSFINFRYAARSFSPGLFVNLLVPLIHHRSNN